MGMDIHQIWTWTQFFTHGFFSWAGKDFLHGHGYGFEIVQPDPNPTHCHPYLHRLLFIQPSTVYCSSCPPRGLHVHPALHGVLFIQPQPARSIGVLFIQRQHHGVLFIHPHRESSKSNAHCSSRGSIDRLQLAAVAKESLDRVQLTAIDRSLGFSNA